MPYENTSELPKSVRNLPSRAKTLYMKAYNGCWEDLESTEETTLSAKYYEKSSK